MNFDNGVVVESSPTPLVSAIGPSGVTVPLSSTAYSVIADRSAGTSVRFSLILVPSSSRRMVATPFAPVTLIGVRLTITSFLAGYSMIVYVPSGFCTVLVTVVVCARAIAAIARVRIAAPRTLNTCLLISCTSLVSNQSRLIVERGGTNVGETLRGVRKLEKRKIYAN